MQEREAEERKFYRNVAAVPSQGMGVDGTNM
jgi:hypothetical protein